MTEAEWLTSTDPHELLGFVQDRAGERPLRLFACACCRHAWPRLCDERSLRAVEAAERYADGLAGTADLWALYVPALNAFHEATAEWAKVRRAWSRPLLGIPPQWNAFMMARRAAWMAVVSGQEGASLAARAATHLSDSSYLNSAVEARRERARQAAWLRDLFGNPFRPSRLDPAWVRWHDDCVGHIARGIYQEQAFDRLPILADALLDAGCDDDRLLAHCREPAGHVRGCWALDLLLGLRGPRPHGAVCGR
jgi:hypothetical protein